MNKKILFIIGFLALFFVGLFMWWYSNKNATPVTVLDTNAEQALTFGWPTEVAKTPGPKATISDFNVDLSPVVAQNTPKPTTVTSGIKPSASSFSVTDVIKPVVPETTCALPALLDSCCSLSGVNRNECIASIALARGLSALCDYITGSAAKLACINAITKPNTSVVDNSLVYVPKTTTVTPGLTTTYTTNSNSVVDPTTYTTDGSSGLSSLLNNNNNNNSGFSGWNISTSTYLYPTSSVYTGTAPTSSIYNAGGFYDRMSEKTAKVTFVQSAIGAYLANRGMIVTVHGEGFATTTKNVLHFTGVDYFKKEYDASPAKSSNGSDFITIIPPNMAPGVFLLSVTKENATSTPSSGGDSSGVRMTVM